MSKNPPTLFVPLTNAELEKLKPLQEKGYVGSRTVTGSKTKYIVRKPKRNRR